MDGQNHRNTQTQSSATTWQSKASKTIARLGDKKTRLWQRYSTTCTFVIVQVVLIAASLSGFHSAIDFPFIFSTPSAHWVWHFILTWRNQYRWKSCLWCWTHICLLLQAAPLTYNWMCKLIIAFLHNSVMFALLDNSENTHVHSRCMWLVTVQCRITKYMVDMFINWLMCAWNANQSGARLSYVNKFAVGRALWLELLFVLFKWRLESLVWHLDILDKLFWHSADKGEMEQQSWITLSMGSILIDILTWKKMRLPKTHPLSPDVSSFEYWAIFVVVVVLIKTNDKRFLFE